MIIFITSLAKKWNAFSGNQTERYPKRKQTLSGMLLRGFLDVILNSIKSEQNKE